MNRDDLLAGLTTAAVVIPQAMAYATIAGLPVQVGLYTALVPMVAYALIGTSRALSVSTTSTLAALTGAAVASVADGDPDRALAAATTLAMLSGALLVAAGALRLGFVADFISQPVLAGFKAGTGLLIAVGQLGKVLGIEQSGDSFFEKLRSALSHLGDISWPTAALAGRRSRFCWRSNAGCRASRARCSRSAVGIAVGAAGPARRRAHRPGPLGPAHTGRARSRPDRAAVAGGAGDRADGVRGVDRRRTGGRARR